MGWVVMWAVIAVVVFFAIYISATYFEAFGNAPDPGAVVFTSLVAAVIWPLLLVGLFQFWLIFSITKRLKYQPNR